MTAVRRLAGVQDILAIAPVDPYVQAECDPARTSSVWAGPAGSFGWVVPSRRVEGRGHLIALGPAHAAAALVLGVEALLGSRPASGLGSVSVPQGAELALHPAFALAPRNDWEWYSTTAAPPRTPGEADVDWLPEESWPQVLALLQEASPRHDAEPGRPGVLRWAGITGANEELIAAAAHTERRAGVPHLASVVTAEPHRGRGLGAAVTSWLTRQLLEEGAPMVTLGMYSDNAIGRRLYQRLGYVCAHAFTSGRLVPAAPPCPDID